MGRKKTFFALFVLIAFFGVGAHFFNSYFHRNQTAKKQKIQLEKRISSWQALQQALNDEISQFKGEVGIVITDLQTDWRFSFNKDNLFPSASLAKIPLMAACFLASQEGKIKLSHHIALKATDKLSGSGVLKNMSPGIRFSIEELIGLMIYESDNTATHMIANIVGLDYLKNSFKVLGLKNTTLSRKIADFHSRDQGIENYTTAADMAFLFEKIYHGSLVNNDISEHCIKLMKLSRINDRIPKYLPAAVTIAHKTGLERSVCHDAGIVFTCEGDFLIVVLTKHTHSDSSLSKEFIAKVALLTYKYFEQL